jgi:hypothetical protein
MVTSKKYKYAKKTKRSRTRRQRHRRRQMRGGASFLDYFKPTVETNDTCKEKYDTCLDKVSGKEDDDSLFKLKLPTFNLFGSSDTNDSAATGEGEGEGELEKEDEGIELQEYPGSEQQATPLEAPVSYAAPASDAIALNAAPAAAPPLAAPVSYTDAAAAPPLAAPVSYTDAAAAPPLAAPVSYTDAAAAASPLSPPPPVESTLDSTTIDAAKLSPPAAEYGLTGQPTAEVEETEAQKNARINNSMGMGMGMVPGVGSGGGSRKKYKKRNANRSKKNKNRRNKRRTNKRN